MRKVALILSVMLALFVSISIVSAQYNCQSSQTIMKLSALNNAHIETYSSTYYSLRVCYDEIFGVNYTLPSAQTCTGSNLVSKLSQSTNAHIEGPSGNAYSVNVCYGDLVCTLRNSVCLSQEREVVSISQSTNAHASLTGASPLKICCSSAFAISNSNNSTNTGAMSFTINSPINNQFYNDSVLLSITSTNVPLILYNFGTGNFSYSSPTSISPANGTYTLNVYAINSTTTIQQSISFSILNTSLYNITVPSNNTNTTNNGSINGTGAMTFTINSPLQNGNYSLFVPINISYSNVSSIIYNFGTGNFSYTSPTIVSLMNGTYTLNLYISNSTTTIQQSILFNIFNSTINSNPSNNTNTTNGTNNGGNNGGSSGGGSGSNNGRTQSTVSQTYSNQQYSDIEGYIGDNAPIVLDSESKNKNIGLDLNLIQSILILLILLAFIIIAQYLINRHNQSRKRRL